MNLTQTLVDVVRGQLELWFDRDELRALCRDVLALDPASLPASASRAEFAEALVRRALATDRMEALCDVLAAVRGAADPNLDGALVDRDPFLEPLARGSSIGGFVVEQVLGVGPVGTVFSARYEERLVRLKVLGRRAAAGRASVERYLARTRAVGAARLARVPKLLAAREVDGRVLVAHELSPGVVLAARRETRARRLSELWPLLRGVLDALVELHAGKLVHGGVVASNIVVSEAAGHAVALVDAGAHFVRPPWLAATPEQICGETPTVASDVYAFGTLLYELLAGRPPFSGTRVAVLRGMLAPVPDAPSFVAPPGFVEAELDELVLGLLDPDRGKRPAGLGGVRDVLAALAGRAARRDSRPPPMRIEQELRALAERPDDEVAAAVLESTVGGGGDPHVVARALLDATTRLDAASPRRSRLFLRAGSLLETEANDPRAAEDVYRKLLDGDAGDESAWAALERLHRSTGDHGRLVELLIERAEREPAGVERARVFGRMTEVFRSEIGDPEQALVAAVQAFCEDPTDPAYAEIVERLAPLASDGWNEVLSSCTVEVARNGSAEARNAMLAHMGKWFRALGRTTRAETCFQTVLMSDPAHDEALVELAEMYRSAHAAAPLRDVLELRAASAVSTELARDLRLEAAGLCERDLGDRPRAIALYEEVAADAPEDPRAPEALIRLYTQSRALDELVRLLERWAPGAPPARRQELLLLLAEAREARTSDTTAAAELYETVLGEAPGQPAAIAGLERTYARLGRLEDLRRTLAEQVERAPTPRQRVGVLQRLAALQAGEFLDRAGAAKTLERLLLVEPSHEGALSQLSSLYEQTGDWDALARTLDLRARAAPAGPRRISSLVALATVLADRLGKPEAAIGTWETILSLDAGNAEALAALSTLREGLGDEVQAARELDTLAALSKTSEAEADNYVRAGDLLAKHGDLTGAIGHWDLALTAVPGHRIATERLLAAHLELGDHDVAVRMLEREVAAAAAPPAQAKAATRLARVLLDDVHDGARAEAAALRALDADPENVDAHVMLGDVDRASSRYAEAAAHYRTVVRHLASVPPPIAVGILERLADALARSGNGDRALETAEDLLARFPDGPAALAAAARVVYDHGSPARAAALHRGLLERFGASLSDAERSAVLCRLGDSERRDGRANDAIGPLEEAVRLDPGNRAAFRALRAAYDAAGRYADVARTIDRELDQSSGAERVELLVASADVASVHLGDSRRAAERYLSALAARPGDRRILLKLVQLYTAERDWASLVTAIEDLSRAPRDAAETAQQLLVAARVALEELGDRSRALALVDRALALSPAVDAVVREAIALKSRAKDTEGLRLLLERQIQAASASADRERAIELGTLLADLHLSELHADDAILVNEALLRIGGPDPAREDTLFDLYASDPTRYLDRALSLVDTQVRRDPYRPEPYRKLLELHQDVKNVDGAWCACQALTALGQAGSDEELYFEKHRSSGTLPRGARLTEEDIGRLVTHPRADALVTRVFAIIQPAIVATRMQALAQAGYSEAQAIDPRTPPAPLAAAIARVSELSRLRPPLLFADRQSPRPLTMPRTDRRCLVLGGPAFGPGISAREATYLAAAHLTYLRDGFRVRSMIPSAPALKAWMLAAIRLIAPRLSVAAELEGSVAEAHGILEKRVAGATRDFLAEPVTALLRRREPVDVARWATGVDLTSDRMALVACGDLATVLRALRGTAHVEGMAGVGERGRELLAFSVSEEYLALRSRLGLGVDAG